MEFSCAIGEFFVYPNKWEIGIVFECCLVGGFYCTNTLFLIFHNLSSYVAFQFHLTIILL